jgi:hypothetical protein
MVTPRRTGYSSASINAQYSRKKAVLRCPHIRGRMGRPGEPMRGYFGSPDGFDGNADALNVPYEAIFEYLITTACLRWRNAQLPSGEAASRLPLGGNVASKPAARLTRSIAEKAARRGLKFSFFRRLWQRFFRRPRVPTRVKDRNRTTLIAPMGMRSCCFRAKPTICHPRERTAQTRPGSGWSENPGIHPLIARPCISPRRS